MSRLKSPFTIIAAGQVNSGSTAYYNLIRFILEELDEKHETGYFSQRTGLRFLPSRFGENRKLSRVIKIHEAPPDRYQRHIGLKALPEERISDMNSFCFLSYRSLRQVAAGAFLSSAYEKHPQGKKKSPERMAIKVVRQNIKIFNQWNSLIPESKIRRNRKSPEPIAIKKINLISFNDIINQPVSVVDTILSGLGLEGSLTEEQKNKAVKRMKDLRKEYKKEYHNKEKHEDWDKNFFSYSQIAGEKIHGGSFLYDWNSVKEKIPEEALRLIEEAKDEIYY